MVRPKFSPFHNIIFLVTEPFGTYDNGGTHRGTDLAPYSRDDDGNVPIYSIVEDGVVIETGTNHWSMGNWVRFRSNTSLWAFTYMHLKDNSINVKQGDKLDLSTRIGIMGETGEAYGRHLHVEARLMNNPSYLDNSLVNANDYMGIKNVSYRTELIEYYYEYTPTPPDPPTPVYILGKSKFNWALFSKRKN